MQSDFVPNEAFSFIYSHIIKLAKLYRNIKLKCCEKFNNYGLNSLPNSLFASLNMKQFSCVGFS